MPKYIVRQNCEYSLLVDAENEKAAIEVALNTKPDEWSAAWSGMEVDEEDNE